MKTSTVILSLLVLNSSVLVGQLSASIIGNVNPILMMGSEALLALGYYGFKVIKDVRDVFDVDVSL
ncbi:hypothetical protein Q2T40_15230 [Winogradskyella maritima]|uniref:Uncharacterized protein n=1 Tax=Winogradskyella maritima TaxID=1517766 RepID=A0ABV8AGU5_9FLAO|nr:hypothetical protein [Winogradskyella maritima]